MPTVCKNRKKRSATSISKLIAEYFKTQPVLKVWLFGSFARGEQSPENDVDILVVLDNQEKVCMKFFGMYEDLKDILGRKVDLVTENSLVSFARQSVDRDKRYNE
ncbi:MAG: nucleotidyltransferase family protein [Bacteroidales bacterium]|nr:nucleotidyltransferase family protein [Bacteroidales bacterium]